MCFSNTKKYISYIVNIRIKRSSQKLPFFSVLVKTCSGHKSMLRLLELLIKVPCNTQVSGNSINSGNLYILFYDIWNIIEGVNNYVNLSVTPGGRFVTKRSKSYFLHNSIYFLHE